MAGSKKDAFETDILKLIFQNIDLAGIGDSTGLRGSSVAGSFYIALFSTAPTDSTPGTEITYTGYARVAVARTSGGWAVSGNNASNNALVSFGMCTGGGPVTAYAYGVCKAGTRDINDAIYWADLTTPLVINTNITPDFAIGDLDINED